MDHAVSKGHSLNLPQPRLIRGPGWGIVFLPSRADGIIISGVAF